MKMNKQSIIFYFIVIAVCALIKLICAPQIELSGFTAIIAASVFTGLSGKKFKNIFLLPLLILFGTDILLQFLYVLHIYPFAGFYSGQIINYILILLVSAISVFFRNKGIGGTALATIAGPTVFFIASNFVVWLMDTQLSTYSRDFTGLITCYSAGLPFYKNSLISTFIFVPVFIALYQWIVYGKLSIKMQKV